MLRRDAPAPERITFGSRCVSVELSVLRSLSPGPERQGP